jgi:lipopolysaccharide transport system permease protein
MVDKNENFLVIEAGKTEKQYWHDLWKYRELFYFLAWRDIISRYKQTVLGIAWSVIRPVLTMIVFTIIFGKIAKLPSGNIPYPIMVFVAMLPWQLFANSLSQSSESLVANAGMVSKVYFPRMILPASSIIVAFIDFFVSFIILGIIMVFYRFVPSWKIVFVPVFLLLTFLLAFGLGLILSALNVKYRDFRNIVPFIVSFGLYISPVGFSSDVISQKWKFLYSINPMVGIIDGFRWCIIGQDMNIYNVGFIISLILTFSVLIIGIFYFRKTEKTFADRI